MSTTRINALRKKIENENLDGLIITDLPQIRYLTNFTGSSALLAINSGRPDFITDSRYTVQAGKQVKGAKIQIVSGSPIAALKDFRQHQKKNQRYGFSGNHITVTEVNALKKAMPSALFVDADSVLNDLGWVKDKYEISSIEKAVKISDIAFERILNIVTPGIREREIAAELEYQMTMLGSEKPAFESIVASGYRSALPHGIASSKKLAKGDFVTFDFGATVNGYVSDITRTIVLGKATSRQKKIYNTVLKAQKAGIRKVKPAVSGVAVDAACRNLIKKAGYGSKFGHGTGHGIGIVVHTGPRVSPLSEDKLMAGNVITIEPGIYIEGWGGVRIEDDVLVTRSGNRVLNSAPKKLLEL